MSAAADPGRRHRRGVLGRIPARGWAEHARRDRRRHREPVHRSSTWHLRDGSTSRPSTTIRRPMLGRRWPGRRGHHHGTRHARQPHPAGRGHRLPVICQKPLAPDPGDGSPECAYCEARGVPLLVHENFRWQTPVRQLAAELRAGAIGAPFRARIEFTTGFPVFQNQPFLRELPRFILSDVGVHVLDVARFLFGEATSLAGADPEHPARHRGTRTSRPSCCVWEMT